MSRRGVVLSIHLLKVHKQPPVQVEEARAVVGHGLEGDIHGKGRPDTSRQILIADRRTLETFGIPHGGLKEQLTVDLPGLDELSRGQLLRVGEVTLEVTVPCEPCEVIGKYNAVADPRALQDALRGRRGMMSKVIATISEGRIRPGDEIVVESAASSRSQ